jgi:hypothetical protein
MSGGKSLLSKSAREPLTICGRSVRLKDLAALAVKDPADPLDLQAKTEATALTAQMEMMANQARTFHPPSPVALAPKTANALLDPLEKQASPVPRDSLDLQETMEREQAKPRRDHQARQDLQDYQAPTARAETRDQRDPTARTSTCPPKSDLPVHQAVLASPVPMDPKDPREPAAAVVPLVTMVAPESPDHLASKVPTVHQDPRVAPEPVALADTAHHQGLLQDTKQLHKDLISMRNDTTSYRCVTIRPFRS